MKEHYGAEIKQLFDRIYLIDGDKHSFFYHKKDFRVLGPDDVVSVYDLEHVTRINTGLTDQRALNYIVVLGDDEFQFVFISNKVSTCVVLFSIFSPQGHKIILDQGVSEPILGLSSLVNVTGEKVKAGMGNWSHIHGYASKLLAVHCDPSRPSIVKSIYRDGV